MLTSPVLVLNLNYQPINVCNVRRAFLLMFRGKAEMLTNGLGMVRTIDRSFESPSVIRLIHMVKLPFAKRKLSKKEIFMRDRHTCQYCGEKRKDLTLDHVVPRRQGGKQTWENIVSACIPCNHKKAGYTPKEAGMKLLKQPRAPYPSPYYVLYGRAILEEWKPFVPWGI
jgi:5-methylcytosine-specific restriction endonuclease McrA